MKKILVLMLMLALCLCFVACDEDEIPEGMMLASDTEIVDYTMYVPLNWTVSNSGTTTQAYSNVDRTNINIAQWDYTGSIEDWWENEYKKQVFEAGAVKEAEVLKNKDGSEGKNYTLNGKAARQYDYTAKIADTFFKYVVIACKNNGSIYVLHITYMQDSTTEVNTDTGEEKVVPVLDEKGKPVFSTVEARQEDIDKILNNFKFN